MSVCIVKWYPWKLAQTCTIDNSALQFELQVIYNRTREQKDPRVELADLQMQIRMLVRLTNFLHRRCNTCIISSLTEATCQCIPSKRCGTAILPSIPIKLRYISSQQSMNTHHHDVSTVTIKFIFTGFGVKQFCFKKISWPFWMLLQHIF